jgi:phosphatidate cytidylyltransferase
MDVRTLGLVGSILVVLVAASLVVHFLRRRTDSGIDSAILATFRGRVWAWWLLFAGLAGASLFGHWVTFIGHWAIIGLFGGLAFWALREFITLTPTRPGDHRALFWVFFLCTPLQFFLVGVDSQWLEILCGVKSYAVFSIFIPVYAFLLIPTRIAMSGDAKRFLERTAKIQAGLLICVYCLSYAPALITMDLPPQVGGQIRLLFFFVLIVQLSDALQYAWSKIPSRHVIVPAISPAKTWEGLLGGTASVTLIGMLLWFATPFPRWWQPAAIAMVVSLMSAAGGLTMAAIKRDRGVKHYGTLV